jgi:hypothetical protein
MSKKKRVCSTILITILLFCYMPLFVYSFINPDTTASNIPPPGTTIVTGSDGTYSVDVASAPISDLNWYFAHGNPKRDEWIKLDQRFTKSYDGLTNEVTSGFPVDIINVGKLTDSQLDGGITSDQIAYDSNINHLPTACRMVILPQTVVLYFQPLFS